MKDMALWNEGDWIAAIASVILAAFLIVGAYAVTRPQEEVGGHPKGLYILFFAEMWERFSYYGMRALLIFYLTQHWLFNDSASNIVYGAYVSLVYITPVLGGWLADRYLGQRKAVLFGAVLLTFGHFFMAFEGGGETLTAMLGGHVQVTSSGLGEVTPQLAAGKVRILAVLSDERLPGKLADIPTAKEQGYDISWPVIRGFYMGPQVSDEQFAWWQGQFEKMLARDDFAALREQRDLFPLSLTGDELNAFVLKQVQDYKALAGEFGLVQ